MQLPMSHSGAFPILFFLVLIYGTTVLALDSHKTITQYVHDVWTSDQGLPQNSVNAVAQTKDGYIWLGTLEGLVRFDGVMFTVFDRKSTPQIKSNRVNALLAGTGGELWIGTEGGAVLYKEGRFVTYTAGTGLLSNAVLSILEDSEKRVWIGTDAGLSVWEDGKFTSYSTNEGLSDNAITSLCQLEDGSIWIGTRKGINLFSKGRIVPLFQQDTTLNKVIRVLYQDSNKRIWIGTQDGLFCFINGNLVTYRTEDGLSNNHVLSILEDRDKNLWIGTRSGGLNRFRDQSFASMNAKDGLSSDFIAALMEDKEGSLWIGSWGGGLDRLRDGKFVTYTQKEGLTYDSISSFFETRDGSLWIGTFSGGLNRWKDGKFTHYLTRDGLTSNVVCTLFEDSKGSLWVGTINGINRYQNPRFYKFNTKDALASDVIYSILEDREGSLWIGSREGGLNRYRNGILLRYTERDGLSNNSVYTMIQTRNGNVWIGTKEGLFRFENERFTHFSTRNGLSDNFVTALYEDSHGVLWIGTSGGGLNRFKNQKFFSITSDRGLFDDVVYSILEDSQGYVWMTSNKGIFRIKMRELNDFADGLVEKIKGVSYGKSDGMRVSECNSGQFTSWKTRDGKLWFATLKGAVMVDPNRIPLNKVPPPVMMEKVIVDEKPVSLFSKGKDLVVPPGKLNFEFHYTGLSFAAPDKVLFKYKLEGFDRDWIDAATRRVAYYSNLNHGRYTFRVIARNNDGFWNQDGASVTFDLQPYYYQTVWFYVFIGILGILFGVIAYHLHLRQIKAQFQTILTERTRIARDLHDTIAQTLSSTIAQIDAADELFDTDSSKSRQYLLRVRNLAQQGLEELRRAVWKLRTESEQSEDFQQSLNRIANRYSSDSGLTIRVHVEGTPLRISEPTRENLLAIAQQAIRNAIQHSSPTSILVHLLFKDRALALSIKDDGCGFDPSSPAAEGGRFGLKGMEERAGQINGRLDIVSGAGKGTQVTVQVSV